MKNGKKNTNTGLPRLVRQINLQSIVRQMRGMGAFSKADLARRSGISTTTTTKLFAQIEAAGLIEFDALSRASFGRPKNLFRISTALQTAAVVIDIEDSTLCFASLRGEVETAHRVCFPTGRDRRKLFARIGKEFSALQQKLSAPCRQIGVCAPGLIEAESGKSVLNPNMHWMEGTRPADSISKLTGIPAIMIHEEKALCRAQQRTDDRSVDYITMDFSAGVGMSVVVNGEHLSGASGFAGEIGHVIMAPGGKLCGCGSRGCLETIASDRVFQTDAGVPMNQALAQLAGGNTRLLEISQRVIEAQATGLAAVINIFNPERIFVCSRLSEAVPNYLAVLRVEVERRAIPLSFKQCKIEVTRAGKLEGTLLLTIDHLIDAAIIHAQPARRAASR